ncbi:MAG TPA: DUF3025 domain-containing protein [Rudaea sp.]
MRFIAPAREDVDPVVFTRPPLSDWCDFRDLLCGSDWPDVAALNERVSGPAPRFVTQTPALLADGLHYEQRIAERGEIATRERNWHDLLNALVWLRFPALKAALNARQMAGIAAVGPKRRTRAQQALTHFDEAGVIALVRDPVLLPLWDAHDWHGLFWRESQAWRDGRIEAIVFGHALLEHALIAGQLIVGKTIAVYAPQNPNVDNAHIIDHVASALRRGELLDDPQELRPLPLSGIPGWHPDTATESFYRTAPCFRPLRASRQYPQALQL